ncbi:mite group 2 allergen-like Ixo r 2 isoform X1 [Tachypleus tridentatus]|uniref:mite group 2 allergen-like Ixo r 2 isoform X1 n=1 Tax=Tachypleus tridentatus TaxID=6853 RepID=UPI003FD0E53F
MPKNGGEITAIRVEPCETEPCSFFRGKTVVAEVDFVANQDSQNLINDIKAKVILINVPFPGLKMNACEDNGITCPITKGQTYTYRFSLEVKTWFPKISTTVTWRVKGDEGDVFCFKTDVDVV